MIHARLWIYWIFCVSTFIIENVYIYQNFDWISKLALTTTKTNIKLTVKCNFHIFLFTICAIEQFIQRIVNKWHPFNFNFSLSLSLSLLSICLLVFCLLSLFAANKQKHFSVLNRTDFCLLQNSLDSNRACARFFLTNN